MSFTFFLIISLIGYPLYTVIGFIMGIYYERVKWNNLIQAGIIPKPDADLKND